MAERLADPAPVLCLPQELLERILEFAVPCGNERYWISVKDVPEYVREWFNGWKDRCCAIRSTCRSFSLAKTPKEALFHTFYWFPTTACLDRLESVAANFPELVRSMSFYRPLFGYEEPDYSTFVEQLTRQTKNERLVFTASPFIKANKPRVLTPNLSRQGL